MRCNPRNNTEYQVLCSKKHLTTIFYCFFSPLYCTAPSALGVNLKPRNSFTRYFFCDLQNELKWRNSNTSYQNTIRRILLLCCTENIRVMKTNLMHNLSTVYFVNQPLHVSRIFVVHHQEVHCIYTKIVMCCAFFG